MKVFLKKIAIFFIVPVLVLIGLEWKVRISPNSYTYKMESFDKQKGTIETLILGDSHSYYGLNPEHFSRKTFNLGNFSQSLKINRLLLERSLDQMPELKTVILPVSTFSLDFELEESEEGWRKYDYIFYCDFPTSDFDIGIFDPRGYSVVLGKGFKSNINIARKLLSGESLVNCTTSGWADNYKGSDENKIRSQAESAAERHDAFEHGMDPNLNRLTEIGALCKQKNVQLILVTLPVSAPYWDAMDQKKWTKTKIILDSFASSSDAIEYIDWLHSSDFGLADFHDPDHLNHVGAKKVSKLLDNYLKLKHD